MLSVSQPRRSKNGYAFVCSSAFAWMEAMQLGACAGGPVATAPGRVQWAIGAFGTAAQGRVPGML